ncbi:UNVERIFIED_CONTAM: hypothetical protein Slati_4280600 [Sesamum latifolium]|uniref:Uncharacterized protein n=1 Tax=Sesamum latifolium TaxID=2727402 RepID=A0AAW2TD95_9LAMI
MNLGDVWNYAISLILVVKVCSSLDSAIASSEWALLFSRASVWNILNSHSDHSVILVETVRDQYFQNKKKHFSFKAMWLRSNECEEVVHLHWGSYSCGSAISALQQNIKKCRVGLLRWDQNSVGNVRRRIRFLEEEIVRLRDSPITAEF